MDRAPHEEGHSPDDPHDDDDGEDGGDGGDGGGGGDEEGGGGNDDEVVPSDDDSDDEGPPASFMTPKPKQMPREPFLAPEASSGSGGTSRDLLGPPPHDPPPGVPPPGVPHDAPPSDSHFKKMNAGWWLHKTPPPARQSGDYRNVTDEIMCLELCLRKALLFTFKITIALTLIL